MGQGRLTATDHAQEWPAALKKAAQKCLLSTDTESEPIVITMDEKDSVLALEKLAATRPITKVIDNYDEQLAELIVSRHAQLYRAPYEVKKASLTEYFDDHFKNKESWRVGSWVYFPWNGQLIHVLEEKLFNESRTIRNKDLITAEEQERFANFNVGCAGLSVGSSAALSLAIQGGTTQLKLSDGGVISASNLNRILTGVASVGLPKSVVIARQIYEMNPYMHIDRLEGNIVRANIDDFFDHPWPLHVVVDEMDDLEIKILLRVEARKRGIPVLMVTDLGDDVMLDVERFDLNPHLPLFHGYAGDIEQLLGKEVSRGEWLRHATTIINTKNVPLRLQQSLLKIGTKLVTQPQLGGTAMAAGAVLAYAVRQLALNEELKSGRTLISLDKHLNLKHRTFKHRRAHRRHTKLVQKALQSM